MDMHCSTNCSALAKSVMTNMQISDDKLAEFLHFEGARAIIYVVMYTRRRHRY
jgi:hypothetical protein